MRGRAEAAANVERALGRVVLVVALALVALAPSARAGGPSMLVGTADDTVRQATLVAAKAKMGQLRLAGFDSVRVTQVWAPGQVTAPPSDLAVLENVAAAARLYGMRVFLAVYAAGSRTTPLTPKDQNDFATFAGALARALPGIRDFVVGNEPNTNRFWLPQFNPDGTDAAAPAYESLLALTYDALKAVSPDVNVIGGALSPRGGDRPPPADNKHSPTSFITDLGAAYRASGRTKPIMDEFAIHPYQESSSLSPTSAHPSTTSIGIADYDKLVGLLGKAFDGTAQPGSTLPIVYGEFGVETKIPEAKASLYTGSESANTKPVDEETQGSYYRQAVSLAFCQANVRAIMILHAFDESTLGPSGGWQSGVFYADGTRKASLQAMQRAARDARGGTIARCPGLQLTPQAKVAYPRGKALRALPLELTVTCDVDCNVYARLEKLPKHSTTLAASGRAPARTKTTISFPARHVAPGRYRFTVRLTAPVNVGPPSLVTSGTIVLR
jgi:hypothetical protein